MEEKIFIPDAVSTGDLLNLIEQRKFEDFLTNTFKEIAQDEELSEFYEEAFEELLEEDSNAIMVLHNGKHKMLTISEILIQINQFKEQGNCISNKILDLVSKQVEDLTMEEEEKIFEFVVNSRDFMKFLQEKL